MRAAAVALVLLLTGSAAVPAELPAPVQQILEWAYPGKNPAPAPVLPPAEPPAPPQPWPNPPVPVPVPPPPPEIAPVKPAGPKPAGVQKPKSRVRTSAEMCPVEQTCESMRCWARAKGIGFVIRQAKARGYSNESLSWARWWCGV